MKNNIKVEDYKIYFSFSNFSDLAMLFVLGVLVVLIIVLVMVILTEKDKDNHKVEVTTITVFSIFTVILAYSTFLPVSGTKTTQVIKKNISIIQMDGKLLSTEGLTLFFKDSHGNYGQKNIFVGGDTKIREAGTKYCYIQQETKITYDFGDLAPVILKPIPKKQSKTEMILTVPKGSLTQNK